MRESPLALFDSMFTRGIFSLTSFHHLFHALTASIASKSQDMKH